MYREHPLRELVRQQKKGIPRGFVLYAVRAPMLQRQASKKQ